MKNWNSVEEKWREQLQNKSEDIPEGLWSRIEERLEEKPTRRFPIYWAAAAMLLIALGLSWNWKTAPEEGSAEVTRVIEKTDIPVEKVATSESETLIVPIKATEPTFQKASLQPASDGAAPITSVIEESVKEDVITMVPAIEKKEEQSPEIVTVRLDINPIVEEEVKPAFTQQKRRKSLFGKIVGEIRQALDGEPVNWQKLKEGNAAFENSIHTVANTYVKTEENFKRTLQLQ
ncbi:hypothetical protein [Aquirufa lenticrescens]|jgi:hypothetical protein|uniref:hypothetical protein n=1 Tax=Aquirufa lenticrescens TaxID=2696560 RepID=UPI001CAA5B59|nr:hypothetical protein [Aquirufa lenticrescens]UAJ13203.1 hypothetical protein G9X62_01090 [Aquirufa lenticrescens]